MSFQRRLASGDFVVLAEMNTPKGVNVAELVANARKIKGRVDAVIIPDMDNGVMRMSALAGGALIHQQGMEAIIHLYCRDRNRMALQGDVLAAHLLGIRNLVVVPGEEMANGDHRDATVVNDLDELELLGAIRSLQNGVDMSGFSLNGNPEFMTGCTLGAFADEQALDAELAALEKKVAAGAGFVITPPVFDVERSAADLEKIAALKVPVIATVFLLKSVGIARYMSLNEPGAHISEEMIKRIRKAPNREMECQRIAGETIAQLKNLVQGVKIETLGWEHKLPTILGFAGL
ncbi:MAG: 5,10-methylenetetrahydrofolate reductase [Desulfobacteraceae bacterium]|nr:5,10-methylenetetrahydrofolate reductase [Desulfobacteraceae bacterium]MBC2753615.1 methylenetetrahydrofolate reductase [Desulfobacteraceae bacterium]